MSPAGPSGAANTRLLSAGGVDDLLRLLVLERRQVDDVRAVSPRARGLVLVAGRAERLEAREHVRVRADAAAVRDAEDVVRLVPVPFRRQRVAALLEAPLEPRAERPVVDGPRRRRRAVLRRAVPRGEAPLSPVIALRYGSLSM